MTPQKPRKPREVFIVFDGGHPLEVFWPGEQSPRDKGKIFREVMPEHKYCNCGPNGREMKWRRSHKE